MKQVTIILMVVMCAVPLIGFTPEHPQMNEVNVEQKPRELIHTLEVLTIYNPVEEQCDDTPWITASNARIDVDKLYRQELRWMALSRDLLIRWNGNFNYGDTVVVDSGDPAIDGAWVIHDTMNQRYANRGDLLFDGRVRNLGRWENVTITKYL